MKRLLTFSLTRQMNEMYHSQQHRTLNRIKTHKWFYNANENLLNRIRHGNFTKNDIQKLLMNQEHLQQKIKNFENGNKTITQMSSGQHNNIDNCQNDINNLQSPMISHHNINNDNNNNNHISNPLLIGSKNNPVYMKKQTTIRELLFSLLPFIFVFWLLGGFEILKNRKQGGVGTIFGNNFTEFDETDWADDDEIEDETHLNNRQHKDNLLNNEKNGVTSNNNYKSSIVIGNIKRIVEFKKHDHNENNANPDTKIDSPKDNVKTTTIQIKHKSVNKKQKQKRVRFKDVCGCDEVKADLIDLVDYLKNPSKYQQMGCKLPKGVLMSSAPGTGKTLLARALAGEAGVPFLATNGASFDEIFVGVGVTRVRKLFERAKERAPCIVFIDEIDAIANTRMQMGTAHSSDSLNALLSEMDGFEQNTGIIVIAATNMPDRLDAALIRPGRFDRKVHIPLPDKKARKDIVSLYLKNHGDADVDVDLLVSDISGFSGAELESMVNLASIEAVKQNENKVKMKHLIEAKEMISMGRARRSLEITPRVKKLTAYHESGHAIVSLFTKGSKPIYKATILPRGEALGFVASSNGDEFMATKESLLAELDVCNGGRVAEEIFHGNSQITTGASSDFKHATQLAKAMVCQYGMSPKVGKMYCKLEDISKLSPVLQNVIDEEVKRLLDESYQRARTMIEGHKGEMEILANNLLSKETLSGDEIKILLNWNENQMREPTDFMINVDDLSNSQKKAVKIEHDDNNNMIVQ